MAHSTLLVCVAVVSCTLIVTSVAEPARACGSLKCPQYTAEAGNGYELRTLTEDTKWVEGSITKYGSSMAWWDTNTLFQKLYSYIQGSNVGNNEIPMSSPVLTKVQRMSPNSEMHQMTMMFYIDDAHTPTTPTDRSLSIRTVPAGTQFYARRFTKWFWASQRDYENNMRALRNSLGADSTSDESSYYQAGYDAPFTFMQTHEVWIEKN